MKARPPLAALLLTLAAAITLHAATPAEDLLLKLAGENAVVETAAGRTFRGQLDGVREGRLFLREARDGGEVGYSFAPTEIAALTMPGTDMETEALELWERGQTPEALPFLEALGRQRSRYLQFLNTKQRKPLFLLVQASALAGDPHAAIGFARLAQPFAESEGERGILRDALLGAHLKLGLKKETRALAEAWCREADPTGTSALGWEVLANLALDELDFDRARWIALEPVALSSHRPTARLDSCYAIALTAAHRLGDTSHALALANEMRERGLEWPANRSENIAALYAMGHPPQLVVPKQAPARGSSTAPQPSFQQVLKLASQMPPN